MNQRDQNQTRRGGHRQDLGPAGREKPGQAEGGRQGRGMDLDEDRDWQSQRQDSRMARGGSAGQRFGETFNPEPQWLREDRGYGGAHARGEEPFDERESEFSGRGSYAGSGRPWGEPQGGYRGEFGGRQGGYEMGTQGERAYASRYGGGYAPRSAPHGAHGEAPGRFGFGGQEPQEFAHRPAGGYPGYGGSRAGMREHEAAGYRTSAFGPDVGETGGWRSRSGYGSSPGYHFGTYQGDTGYAQRSYRGMGPQNYQRPDERIRDDLYERLTDSHEIDARWITVDVHQGNVTLGGAVPERHMRYAAEDLVEACMGVTNINNQIKVQDTSAGGSGQGASASGTDASPAETKRH